MEFGRVAGLVAPGFVVLYAQQTFTQKVVGRCYLHKLVEMVETADGVADPQVTMQVYKTEPGQARAAIAGLVLGFVNADDGVWKQVHSWEGGDEKVPDGTIIEVQATLLAGPGRVMVNPHAEVHTVQIS